MLQAKTVCLVLLWWIANGLTSIFSKTEMSKPHQKTSLSDMKWLDLTILQFFFGVLGSAFWILFIERRCLKIKKVSDWNGFVVILGNLIGHLSVNVSYAFVSSSATQVVKSSEPVFMFFFLIFLRSQHIQPRNVNTLVLFSIFLMVLGTLLFVTWDVTFNVWGIAAAIASNIAFPLRNIALKNMSRQYESSFEKYFTLSFFGMILLLIPFFILKFIFQTTSSNMSQAGITSGSFHCVYNLASISVLQCVSPLNHAILNFSKRIFVIALNINYFNLLMTWHMFVGLGIIFLGLGFYLFSQNAKSKSITKLNFRLRKCSPRQFCWFFLVISFLVLLPSFLYLPKHHKTGINELSPHFEVNSINEPYENRTITENLTTSWIFSKPIPDVFIEHIVTAHIQTGAYVHVYCGTTKCLETIKKLNKPMITTSFFVVPNVLGQTPLKEWGERHSLYKILTGLRYEWYLTQGLCLAHLWQYGGRFYLSSYRNIRFQDEQENWPCMSLEDVIKENAFIKNIRLPPRDEHVKQKMEKFLEQMESWNSQELPDIFRDTVRNAYSQHCSNTTRWCLIKNPKSLRDFYARDGIPFEDENHFGTLSYDGNVGFKNKANIGDEIQTIAGIQFLPFLDFFLDRDLENAPDTRGKHVVFFNAWWGNRKRKWPPSENIDPIMVSVHTTWRFRQAISSSSKAINFLKSKAPIGARDMVTKRFMESIGVQSFFSGCMTLFIQNPQPRQTKSDTTYIVDVSIENQNLLPEWITEKAKVVQHDIIYGNDYTLFTQKRSIDAYKHLERYSRARLVITQRIHAALPCVAMGTPVIFFNGENMPGGGGIQKKPSERVEGLVDLFHTIDLYNITTEQAKDKLKNFNWNNPPRNPNLAIRMRMISSMWLIIRRNQAIYESVRRFGMLPFTPHWLRGMEPSHIFHVVHDDSNQETRSSKDLTWRQWRCIESILRHHPTSTLFVYSNTIEQSVFDVLTEVGYQITIKNYKLSKLAEKTPLKKFLNLFEKTSSNGISIEKILYQNGLLGLLLIYKYGGVYLAKDTIVLKTIDISQRNVISLDTESNVNPWMLNFEKRHEFLHNVLEMFPTVYDANMKPDEGKALLTKIWKSWRGNTGRKEFINIAKKNSFYCLMDSSETLNEEHIRIIKNEVYVMRIPDVDKCLENKGDEIPRLKQGTICKELYNEYCLFCSNQY